MNSFPASLTILVVASIVVAAKKLELAEDQVEAANGACLTRGEGWEAGCTKANIPQYASVYSTYHCPGDPCVKDLCIKKEGGVVKHLDIINPAEGASCGKGKVCKAKKCVGDGSEKKAEPKKEEPKKEEKCECKEATKPAEPAKEATKPAQPAKEATKPAEPAKASSDGKDDICTKARGDKWKVFCNEEYKKTHASLYNYYKCSSGTQCGVTVCILTGVSYKTFTKVPTPDGTTCGSGKVCKSQKCVAQQLLKESKRQLLPSDQVETANAVCETRGEGWEAGCTKDNIPLYESVYSRYHCPGDPCVKNLCIKKEGGAVRHLDIVNPAEGGKCGKDKICKAKKCVDDPSKKKEEKCTCKEKSKPPPPPPATITSRK